MSRELASGLKKSVGFRNIAVHNYDSINWLIVHSIVKHNLGEFTEFAKAIVEWLEKKSTP